VLGVHFAVTPEQERALIAAAGRDDDGDDDGDGESVGEVLEELEESWDDDGLKVDTDKAWDAMHRCLTDGTLDGDEPPLGLAVLGGRHLSEECYVVHITAAEVLAVAAALPAVTEAWLRERYDAIDPDDYDGALGDEDFAYTWSNFVDVREFYRRAAAAGRAVIFTAT
jgi:hypothetical protein